MAVVAALVGRTAHQLIYLITQDGNAGTTVTIPNVGGVSPDLQTDAGASPLGDLLKRPVASQAVARGVLLGNGIIAQPPELAGSVGDFCECDSTAFNAGGAAGSLAVDANVTGPNTPPNLALTAPAAAGQWLLKVRFQHSLVR